MRNPLTGFRLGSTVQRNGIEGPIYTVTELGPQGQAIVVSWVDPADNLVYSRSVTGGWFSDVNAYTITHPKLHKRKVM